MARPSILSALVLGLGLLFAPAAHAQDPGPDEVTLKNGGSIRGTVIASEPGTSVSIMVVGQPTPRVLPWSEVAGVQKGKYAEAAPPPPPPGYAPPPAAPAPGGPPPGKMGDPGVVRLHIESPKPATLLEEQTAMIGYGYSYNGGYNFTLQQRRPVCTAPCDQVVDGSMGRVFTLSDELYPSPGPITFAGMRGDVTMRVRPGHRGELIGGVWAIILGGATTITGAVMLPVSLVISHPGESSVDTGFRDASIGLLVGGAVVLGAGIALVVTGRTKVTLEQTGGPVALGKGVRLSTRSLALEF